MFDCIKKAQFGKNKLKRRIRMNFTCRKLKCKNNNNCVCSLNKITIHENLDCEMFECSNEKVDDKTRTMFDKVPEFETYKHHKEVAISCKTDCIFNVNGECMANGIIVNQTKPKDAKCVSYLKR